MPDNAPQYGPVALRQEFQLSTEIIATLELYVTLLEKWNRRINLVGPSTLTEIWSRHIRDSAQLAPLIQSVPPGPWLDIGSGAGFPGLVLAIMGATQGVPIQLVESNQRKAEFLREVIRQTGCAAQVRVARAESLNVASLGGNAALIMARALAPLPMLFDLTADYTDKNTVFLFLKGQDIDQELTEASKYRIMTVTQHPSRTNSAGVVLRITEVARVRIPDFK